MTAKASVEKWGNYWRAFRASLTHQVYLESVSDIVSRRIEGISSGDKRPLILDIGCGQSQLDVFIAEKTGCQIVALDIIEEALKVGKRLVEERRLHSQVSLIRASVYQLPFPDNSFDIVVSTGSESAATGSRPFDTSKTYRGLRCLQYRREGCCCIDGRVREWKTEGIGLSKI